MLWLKKAASNFDVPSIWIHGTKTDFSDRLIPTTEALRNFLERLKQEAPRAAHSIGAIRRELIGQNTSP